MKKSYWITLLAGIVVTLCISGCSVKETQMKEIQNPISDFEKLYEHTLTVSETSQPTENIGKIYFYEIEDLLNKDVLAIDLQNGAAQLNPGFEHRYGDVDFEIDLSAEDIAEVYELLEDSHVESWEEYYSYGDKSMLDEMGGEGYNWTLLIQYKNGTMENKRGKGIRKKEIQPEGYDTFVNGLTALIASKNQ